MRGGRELRLYYRAVARRAWVVVLLAALVAGGAYWRMRAAGSRYSASTTLIVTAPLIAGTPQVNTGSFTQGQLATPSLAMVINDMINLLRARPVTEPVAKQFGVSVGEVRGAVSASRIRDTDLVSLRAVAEDPGRAARIANASAAQLIRHFRDLSRRDAREVRLFIERQLAESRAKLEASDRRILAYKRQHGVLDITQEISTATSATAALRTDRDNTMLQLRETEAKLAAAQRRVASERAMQVVSGTLKDNPLFQQYQARLGELEIQRATLSQTYTPRHPKYIQAEGEIAAIRRQMLATAKKVVDNEVSQTNPIREQLLGQIVTLEVDRAASRARLAGVNFLDRRQQVERLRLPAVSLDLGQLVRENTVLAQAYEGLSEKYQDALLRENEAGYLRAGVSVMETATPPVKQEGRLPLRLSIAALVGMALGLMVVVLLDASEDRIRSAQEAEGVMGAPVLATVPDVAPKGTAAGSLLLLGAVLIIVLGAMAPTIGPVVARLVAGVDGHAVGLVAGLNHQISWVMGWIR